MLEKSSRRNPQKSTARIAIVASAYNADYVDGMLDAALAVLSESGVDEVEVVRVPGAFEVPVVASKLARRKRKRLGAVICLGVILRGQTTHSEHIGQNVSRLLGDLAMETGVPIIHEVLLLENKAQARARCLSAKTNRGAEAVHTALEMVEVMRETR